MRTLLFTLFIILYLLPANAQQQNVYTRGNTTNMVLVPTGTFWMGIDSATLNKELAEYPDQKRELLSEFPAFKVYVPSYYLDKNQVTNADFRKFVKANPQWLKGRVPANLADSNYLKDWKGNNYPKGQGNYPVVNVSWCAAKAYAYWAGKRLPNEAEMEYVSKYQVYGFTQYPWGIIKPDILNANYAGSKIGYPVAVMKYPPNALGLYDLAGNVWEFCEDNWREKRRDKNYSYTDETVIKGGSFNSTQFDLRATRRSHVTKESCLPDLGFRCAMNYLKRR